MLTINKIGENLVAWEKCTFGNIIRKITRLKKKLSSLVKRDVGEDDMGNIQQTNKELNKLLICEEIM